MKQSATISEGLAQANRDKLQCTRNIHKQPTRSPVIAALFNLRIAHAFGALWTADAVMKFDVLLHPFIGNLRKK
jgi:hypothetical protein